MRMRKGLIIYNEFKYLKSYSVLIYQCSLDYALHELTMIGVKTVHSFPLFLHSILHEIVVSDGFGFLSFGDRCLTTSYRSIIGFVFIQGARKNWNKFNKIFIG